MTANTLRWAVGMMTSLPAHPMDGAFQREQSLSYGQTETVRCDGKTDKPLPPSEKNGCARTTLARHTNAKHCFVRTCQLGVNVTGNERGARTKLPSCLGVIPSANAISSIESKSWLAEISTSIAASLLPIQKCRPRAKVL